MLGPAINTFRPPASKLSASSSMEDAGLLTSRVQSGALRPAESSCTAKVRNAHRMKHLRRRVGAYHLLHAVSPDGGGLKRGRT
jgi:hypothetical protein